jgi:uncharacterized repeat protein (TIGR01451 family)
MWIGHKIARAGPRAQVQIVGSIAALALLSLLGSWGVNRYSQYRLDHGSVKFAVQVQVKVVDTDHSYKPATVASPNEVLEYVIVVTNVGTGIAHNVIFGANLAPYLKYVCGSARYADSNTTSAGDALPLPKNSGCAGAGVITGGQYLDDLDPSGSENLYFQTHLDSCIPPGQHLLQTVGVVQSKDGDQIYNLATVNVDVPAHGVEGCPVGVG